MTLDYIRAGVALLTSFAARFSNLVFNSIVIPFILEGPLQLRLLYEVFMKSIIFESDSFM